MKKRFKILLIIVILFILSGLSIFGDFEIEVYSTNFSPLSYPASQSVEYKDTKLDIFANIPSSWNIRIAFENPDNDKGVINRRILFENSENIIILDVWRNKKMDIKSNYNKLQGVMLRDEDRRNINGKINGLDAIFSSDLDVSEGNQPHLSTFFQSEKYIYRINYPITSDTGVEADLKFISDFKIINRKEGDTDFRYLNLPRKKYSISLNFIKRILAGSDTCGIYSLTGNPFPCCTSGGNCTWWAIYKRPDLKDKITYGNAGPSWIEQAQQAGLTIHSNPVVGSIAVWGPLDNRSGHVAYVYSKTSNELFNISEMNCSGSSAPGPRDTTAKKHYSDFWKLTFLGFIGGNDKLVIENQNINGGTFSSQTEIIINPNTTLKPTVSDIILKIQ